MRRMGSQRTAKASTRISSAFGNQCVVTVSSVTMFWKAIGTPPPGTSSTASAAPAQMKSMASVTMMSAIRVKTMMRPVSAPARPAHTTSRSENRSASRKLMCTMFFAATTLTRLIIEPTERSMPPEMITTA